MALVTLVAFGGSFDGEFVSDDIEGVRGNAKIHSLAPDHLREIFTTFDDSNFIPIKVLSLAIDYRLWGAEPAGFHATNLVIHIGCALLIYAILLRLGLARTFALLVAMLWAVHPLQVESVAWISERKNVLSGIFFFAAFYVYLGFSENRRPARYLGVLGLYALALLSKMNTMVLPAIFLAHEGLLHHRLRRRDIFVVVPMLAMGALVAWYNLAGNPIHGVAWHGGSRTVTWFTSAIVFFRYLGKIVFPIGLAPAYDVPLRGSLLDLPVLAAVIGLAVLGATTLILIVRRERGAFWILWFVICLSPMLNILTPFRALMQDRYMYLPLLGPLAFGAWMLSANARSSAARRGIVIACAAAIAVSALITHRQVEVWSSEFTLWKSMTLRVARYWGDASGSPEGYEEKVAFLREAAARRPTDPVLHNNLGGLYLTAGNIADAIPLFERAARDAPGNAKVLSNLGNAYLRTARLDSAEEALRKAAQAEPGYFAAHLNLARLHLARGDAAEARAELEACARIRPGRLASGGWRRERAYLERLESGRPDPE